MPCHGKRRQRTRARKTRRMPYRDEIDVLWHRPAKTWRRVETLCKQASEKIGWDRDYVWDMILKHWKGDSSDFNARDQHFGFSVTWSGGEVDIYMYSER